MTSTHSHPNPWLDRLTQYGAAALLILIGISLPLQAILALSGTPLFALTAAFTLLLGVFLLLPTAVTPALTITPEALILQPRLWKAQTIPWQAVQAIKPYPLLPPPDAELSRRYLAGKKKYRPAEGLMLVIPGLPVQYRIAGWLAGEGLTPVIAVTNRTHQRYEMLVKKMRAFSEDVPQEITPVHP